MTPQRFNGPCTFIIEEVGKSCVCKQFQIDVKTPSIQSSRGEPRRHVTKGLGAFPPWAFQGLTRLFIRTINIFFNISLRSPKTEVKLDRKPSKASAPAAMATEGRSENKALFAQVQFYIVHTDDLRKDQAESVSTTIDNTSQ